MGRSYTLDTEAAKQANTGGKRITESGAYAGTLKAAFYEKNEKGTESVHLMFEADNGQEIGPLAIYTHSADGTPLQGYNAFNALLTCLRIKAVDTKMGNVELYDFDSQKVVTKRKELYSALSGKPAGLLLRQEEYKKQNGDVGTKMTLAGSYEPSSRLMAGEILAKKTDPVDLDKAVTWLAANPIKHLRGGSRGSAPSGGYSSPAPAVDFADDDIPF